MGNLIELNRFVTFITTKNTVKLGFSIQIIFVISVRTNNLFLTLFVKIKVLVAYAVPKNYVVVKLLIIQMYTALFPLFFFYCSLYSKTFKIKAFRLLCAGKFVQF